MKLHVIMACRNRRDLTLQATRSVSEAATNAGFQIDFTIFDDGSSDGTTEALRELENHMTILRGNGTAFWAKSMATAESALLERLDVQEETDSWIVWLNDDVQVDKTAFERAKLAGAFDEQQRNQPSSVAVGATRDPQGGSITYSGFRKSGWHPLRFAQTLPTNSIQLIDAFNGNLVFVPVDVARRLGGIDGNYSHALADIDYGLRCGRLGIPVVLLPNSFGTCSKNETENVAGIAGKWKLFIGPKGGGHLKSLIRIVRKNSPKTWGVYVFATYALWFVRNLTPAFSRDGNHAQRLDGVTRKKRPEVHG
jgi:GT2 family glycosyltransferase